MADDDIDTVPASEVEARIAAAVEEATKGLKTNNASLKEEKTRESERARQADELIESLGGADTLRLLGNADTVKQLAEMRKRFEADNSNKLLAEGKYDEWFDHRTSGLRKDYETRITATEAALNEERVKGESTTGQLRQKILENEVTNAAASSGILPGALLDVRLRAQQLFKYDAEYDRFVLRDHEGGLIFGKDGKSPKSMNEWLDDQKEVSDHWWPGSRGGGAAGSDVPGGGTTDDLANLQFREYADRRRKGGFKSGAL